MLDRWLTDVQLANIFNEHWKAYNNTRFKIRMNYPRSQHFVLENLRKRKNRGKLWEKNSVVFKAMNVGNNHWSILAGIYDGSTWRKVRLFL